ncbi:MAG TPA: acyl-CoA thioesterase [Bacteroidia bacterium]|nr:acyl-CoA thioesterase [Bacteroidia bacterium]
MPEIITPIQIRFSDIDCMGHVNNAVYLSYIEKARIDFSERLPLNINWRETGFILAQTQINYRHPALLNDNISVRTWCTRVGTKSFDLGFEVFKTTDNNKIILADGLTVLVCYNYRLSVSENLPKEWKKLLLKK